MWASYEHWIVELRKGSRPVLKAEKGELTQIISIEDKGYMTIGSSSCIDFIQQEGIMSLGLSMRHATCLRRLYLGKQELIAVGGSDGMVDIFSVDENRHVMVLLSS